MERGSPDNKHSWWEAGRTCRSRRVDNKEVDMVTPVPPETVSVGEICGIVAVLILVFALLARALGKDEADVDERFTDMRRRK